MKMYFFDGPFETLNLSATYALLIPLVVILFRKSTSRRNQLPLVICFTLLFLHAIAPHGPAFLRGPFTEIAGILLQPVLVLYFLASCFDRRSLRQLLRVSSIILLLALLTTVMLHDGIRQRAFALVQMTGMALILTFSLQLFSRRVKETIYAGKAARHTLIPGALVFAHACFGVVWLVNYLFPGTRSMEVIMVYEVAMVFLGLTLGLGILLQTETPTPKPIQEPMTDLSMARQYS